MSDLDDLFLPVIDLPEPIRAARYRRLVGLDKIKTRLRKEAQLLADPELLTIWSRKVHGNQSVDAMTMFTDRAPLFVFAGDVGSGKSALAESFGCDLADSMGLPVRLYRLKLSARGSGLVGEMTSLIGDAFAILHKEGVQARSKTGRARSVIILVVDEADALAQSRGNTQMHHEDRAGVDALLAGVDSLAGAKVPVIVVLCTNRESALDPAVMRRAAATFTFSRPAEEQRRELLQISLDGLGVSAGAIEKLVELTGPECVQSIRTSDKPATKGRPGFTHSDIAQRLVPAAVLQAFPNGPVTDEILIAVASTLEPTPVFQERD